MMTGLNGSVFFFTLRPVSYALRHQRERSDRTKSPIPVAAHRGHLVGVCWCPLVRAEPPFITIPFVPRPSFLRPQAHHGGLWPPRRPYAPPPPGTHKERAQSRPGGGKQRPGPGRRQRARNYWPVNKIYCFVQAPGGGGEGGDHYQPQREQAARADRPRGPTDRRKAGGEQNTDFV